MKSFNTGGEDTAHISLYVEWKDIQFYEAICDWKAAQALGKEGHDTPLDERVTGFDIGQYQFEVLPYGYNAGNSKYSYYPYVIVGDGIRYCFSDRKYMGDKMKCPNMRIEMGSLPLMLLGFAECWRRANEIIRLLGGKLHKSRIARIDVCVDLPGISVDTMQKAVWDGRMISRAKYKSRYAVQSGSVQELDEMRVEEYKFGKKRTGIVIGRSGISCRIYDKIHESRCREDKLLCLTHKRWGGEIPKDAARVEFQLRSEALRKITVENKKSKIETVEDWQKCKSDICKYLCKSWLRLYRKDFDSSHTARLKEDDLLPAWKRVIDAFECWTGEGNAKSVKRESTPLRLNAFALIQEGFGCLRAAFIRCGVYLDREDPQWINQFCEMSNTAFKRLLDCDGHARFFQRQRDAANKLDASLPWDLPFGLIA
ncbi:MAG: hypothetical protein JXR97_05455 [Planctomycetes bacterium]|nr:hypothetical protein [Planctomycetota bacterium]